MLIVRYYKYFKDEITGTKLEKEELLLRVAECLAQWSRNPKVLNATITRMPRVEKFCTSEPYLEGEEVFGFHKHKTNIPLGFEHKSHK
jgi:hypothetical protein